MEVIKNGTIKVGAVIASERAASFKMSSSKKRDGLCMCQKRKPGAKNENTNIAV